MKRIARMRFAIVAGVMLALVVGTQPAMGYVGSNDWVITIKGPRIVKCEHRYKYEARVRDFSPNSKKKGDKVANAQIEWRMVREPAGAIDRINGVEQADGPYPTGGTPVITTTRKDGKTRVFVTFDGAAGRARTLRATAVVGGSWTEIDIIPRDSKRC